MRAIIVQNARVAAIFLVASLAMAWAAGDAPAMPRGSGSPPSPGVPSGAPGGESPGGDAKEEGGAPAESLFDVALPDNVLRVDGVSYSAELFRTYVRDAVGEPVAKRSELLRYLNEMALDIAGYDVALEEMPALKDDASSAQAVDKLKSRLLPPIYLKAEVRDKVTVTPEDILRKLPDPSPKYDISVITNREEGQIDAAAKALSQGEPFDNVARNLSDGLTAHKGGKVGTVVEGKYDIFSEAEFRVVKSLKEGENSRPFMTRVGWTIVRLDKYWSPEELKRLDVEQNFPRYKAEAEKERFDALFADVQKRYPVVWNDNNLARVRAALDNESLRTDDLRSIEIFRVGGTPVYAPDFFDAMAKAHSPESLEMYLEKRMRSELLWREAERLGYAKGLEPVLDLARRRAVTREFFRQKSRGFKASEGDIRAYYEKNREKYRTEESRRLLVIETPDRKKADEAYGKAKKGTDFRTLARSYAYREEQRKVGGDVGYVYRKNLEPKVGDKVFKAKEGAVLPPMAIAAAGGGTVYAVVRVESVRKAGYRPFEEVNRGQIADRIVAARMGDYHKEFIAKVDKSHKVEILVGTGGGGA